MAASDLPVRLVVRALDGLRGFSRHAHGRIVGRRARQQARGRRRARTHWTNRHGCGDHHVAAFSGFIDGRIAGLQEFGLRLAVAIFVDATIVRAVLVPALMAVLGRWNWWLRTRIARLARVEPSPLMPRPERSC
jgi:hypothetical protein